MGESSMLMSRWTASSVFVLSGCDFLPGNPVRCDQNAYLRHRLTPLLLGSRARKGHVPSSGVRVRHRVDVV